MKKGRKILLLEPNYKNKYPPIGLMKIATYHRRLGDSVTFFKGNLKEFVLDQILKQCVNKLDRIEVLINWPNKRNLISAFLKKKDLSIYEDNDFLYSSNKPLIKECLKYYRNYYLKKIYKSEPLWDRIYVTTLFTFHWKITIETIEFAKSLVKDQSELKVGGIMASLLPKEIRSATNIKAYVGLLDKPSILDSDNDILIDNLPLDYSILEEINYEYATNSAYITFMTKGCKRKCSFCAVPKIEPTYIPKIDNIDKYNSIKKLYGEQQNLLLMDNNALASPNFPDIIQEIKEMGFYKGATYVEPNQLDISIRNLKNCINDKAYIKKSFKLIHGLIKYLRGKTAQDYFNILCEYELLKYETVTKDKLLSIYTEISSTFERYRPKNPKLRYVDFNQGIDCRYITEEYMKLLSEIPIRPLRIAFDSMGLKNKYIQAIELAAKYGIKKLSNYILFNFHDRPEDLYLRLRINMELSEKLGIHIYSFPMKYIPLYGEEAKDRSYIGKNWNIKFIRAVQSILNVTNGIVAPANGNGKGRSFFEKAFGRNIDEFFEILYMPDTYIVYRKLFEQDLGYTVKWLELFKSLNNEEFELVKHIIESNVFQNINEKVENSKLIQLLNHYTITRTAVKNVNADYKKLKLEFDQIILNNNKNQKINIDIHNVSEKMNCEQRGQFVELFS